MNTGKLKESVNVTKKGKVFFVLDENKKTKIFKPWLGDIFSFLYDWIMGKYIFPKKFNGTIQKHFEILKIEFHNIQNMNILEIAAGSGNAVEFVNHNNIYTGTDISTGLLRIAAKKFNKHQFQNAEFFNADVNDLPFNNNFFDLSFCNLSLNFFNNIENFIKELKRVLKPGGIFFCSVPVPEKKKPDVKIRGTLYSENELKQLFGKYDLKFEELPYKNGALLYFKALNG